MGAFCKDNGVCVLSQICTRGKERESKRASWQLMVNPRPDGDKEQQERERETQESLCVRVDPI